jgi:hypothetical protein
MENENFFPASLGGKGSFDRVFDGFPYSNHAKGLKEYYLITQGFHIAGFIIHLASYKKKDFIEMGLHHLLTIILYLAAYMINVWEAGIVIAFLHDIAEIFINLAKTLAETIYNRLTLVVFLVLMILWFYTRIYLLGSFIYQLF